MAETTNIEWADATANFWIGCTKLSPACDHCYAEADWDHRKHRVTWGPHGDRSPAKAGPIVVRKMQRRAHAFFEEQGRKPRIFVNSLSDVGDNHRSIQPEWREAIWQAARECPDVILMLLTKRPQNMPAYLPADWGDGYPNVWIGTTVENQPEADRRREHLARIPATAKFVSYEPALGPVDWTGWEFVQQIIGGGESGPKARPAHPDWFRGTRNWCSEHDISYFHKQNGEFAPGEIAGDFLDPTKSAKGMSYFDGRWDECWSEPEGHCDDEPDVYRIGKKRAGRLLDGRAWNEVPSA